ncbi:MAG TPA: DUF3280 domain-containing protein, partial [Rhodopila sp.]|nr:DUF3280 domain-containing protein [Rhodopila sp.]
MKTWPSAILGVISLATAGTAGKTPSPTAVFDFSFDDTSLEGEKNGPRLDEQKRLAALNIQLGDILEKSGCCQVERPPARETENLNIQTCNGCDLDIARKLGATISVIGWVQKISNLILNINVVARNVSTGQVI